jgi:hypothetical protein
MWRKPIVVSPCNVLIAGSLCGAILLYLIDTYTEEGQKGVYWTMREFSFYCFNQFSPRTIDKHLHLMEKRKLILVERKPKLFPHRRFSINAPLYKELRQKALASINGEIAENLQCLP